MPRKPQIYPVVIVDSNGTDIGTSNPLSVTALQDTPSDLNASIQDYFQNNTVSVAYDTSNNATQVITKRSNDTSTKVITYDTSNNATQIVETIV